MNFAQDVRLVEKYVLSNVYICSLTRMDFLTL